MAKCQSPWSLLVPAVWVLGLSACPSQPAPAPVPAAGPAPAAADQEHADGNAADAKAVADADAKAETPAIPPLSEEDLALIAADPKDLTPEMRVKRAHARRRQIMQNPDSPTARALRDLAEAHQAGEIDVEKKDGVWLHAPGTKPTKGRPPAGWRPSDADPTPAPDAEPADASPSAP